jgi:hypothetical protein
MKYIFFSNTWEETSLTMLTHFQQQFLPHTLKQDPDHNLSSLSLYPYYFYIFGSVFYPEHNSLANQIPEDNSHHT